jgi:hypothetical protein
LENVPPLLHRGGLTTGSEIQLKWSEEHLNVGMCLRHAKPPTGTIRIRYDAVDAFLEQFADSERQVDAVVDQLFRELTTK